MKVKKKSYLTLIEIMISAALILFLASSLMGFYRFALSTQTSAKKLSLEAMQTLYTREHLSHILTNATAKKTNKPFWFYTSEQKGEPSLIFTYDAGAKANPLFSNTVLGRLFLQKGELILLTWPTVASSREPHAPMLLEVIAENIESIQWSFYNLTETNKTETPIANEIDKQGWVDQWPKEKDKLPALLRLKIKQKNKKEEIFTFPLTHFIPQTHQVSYP